MQDNGSGPIAGELGRRALGQAMLGMGIAGLLGIDPARAQTTPVRGGTLVAGLPYDKDTLNPYATGFLGDVEATVFEGLLAPNEKLEFVPVLATVVPSVANGGIVLSADGKRMTITYKLRPDVKWADGEPFTSEDVRFTWEAVKDPKFIGESKDGTQDVDSIETPDPLTAVVHYNTVTPNFASTLFSVGVFPAHILRGKSLNSDPWWNAPFGTGPFMVKEFRRGEYALAERNPHYWGRDASGAQLPYLDRIQFKMMPDQNVLVTQLKAGEIKIAYTVPYTAAPQIAAMPDMEVIPNRILSWQYVAFNFKGPASLRDVRVRQAIAHAINKTTISRALGGYPYPVKSVVLPSFWYYDPNSPDYPYDIAKAKALLDEAGYKPGPDGVRAKGDDKLSYRFVCQAGLTADEVAQQVIIANLKAIGIDAKADNSTGVAFREARYHNGYDLLYARWLTPSTPNYSVFYSTHGPNNGMGYSNPELDDVLFKAEHALDQDERKKLLFQFQQIMGTELPVIPTTSNVNLVAVTRHLKNFVANPTNRTDFINTSYWYLQS
jgi:peptide/nickel transport system substrate-binding protein